MQTIRKLILFVKGAWTPDIAACGYTLFVLQTWLRAQIDRIIEERCVMTIYVNQTYDVWTTDNLKKIF